MNFSEFKLERYFAKYEFCLKYLLSSSDCESLSLKDLLQIADKKSLDLWNNLHLGYTESKGHPDLISEIAKLYDKLDEDSILATVPEEGIFIGLSSILEKNDHVIIMMPAYQSLVEIPKAIGCNISEWPIEIKDNKWSLNIELFQKLIRNETKLLIINFPHNPSGYLPTQKELDVIIEICRKHGIYIFSDEMYRLSEYDSKDRLSAVGNCYENGISLSGLSKTFGLPGLRTGWLASLNKELLKKFTIKKDYTTICGSAPSEILAIIALRAKEKIIERNLSIINRNLVLANNFMDKYKELFRWIAPKAGSVAFTELLLNIPIDSFCEEVINKTSVMVLPSSVFNYPGNYFRLGLGRENFAAALDKFEGYVNELKV